MTELITKTCVSCKENKPLDAFPKYSRHLDGLPDECRGCHKIARDARKTATPAAKINPVEAVLEHVAKTQAIIDADNSAAAKKAKLAAQARARRAAKKAAL